MITQISIAIIVLIVVGVISLYVFRVRTGRDDFKGSQMQAIYTMASQLADREFLDASFLEIYHTAITHTYDLPQKVLTDNLSALKRCFNDKELALQIITDCCKDLPAGDKANLLARAISLTGQIEGHASVFSKQIRIPNSRVTQSYRELLQLLQISSEQVKNALQELNQKSKKASKTVQA
ncbi:hypothetical protein [Psittacicella hinzii]|uniref:Uncharacterized protein n=1 Tax=Psittacicella hinzii TaxID=2028575 RepID=A0A3A1YTS2_9GAMM|nr:hypothetical protein [Psittacicella hinzii]RIY40639.1 hypothetical protein CKF58_00240 [Psittacicella hinzii]